MPRLRSRVYCEFSIFRPSKRAFFRPHNIGEQLAKDSSFGTRLDDGRAIGISWTGLETQQDVSPKDRCESLMARYSFWFRATYRKLQTYCASIFKTAREALNLACCRRHKTDSDSIANSSLAAAAMAHYAPWMNDRLVLVKLLHAMDADARQIIRWKLQGYTDSEIAERLGSTSNAVSVRLARSLENAARSVLLG
jgi:hypothetical protein